MTDLISKVLGLVLAFLLMFVAPLSVLVVSEISADRRSIVNEVTTFIDEVIDSGVLTDELLESFYIGISSYGPIVDAKVMRYSRVINPEPGNTGKTYITYMANDNIYEWNQGDQIKVTVKTIGYTGMERFAMNTLGFSLQQFEFTLAGRVRG